MKRIMSIILTIMLVITAMPLGSIQLTASAETNEDYIYTVIDGTVKITGTNNAVSGDLTIPSTLEGYKVTSIGAFAFSDCSNLKSVKIPDSVVTIENYAFFDCYYLQIVDIGSGVANIGSNVFADCQRLVAINVSGSNNNFSSKDGVLFSKDGTDLIHFPVGKQITSYEIPTGVTNICDGAFSGCRNLTNITIPDGVVSIDFAAFASCTNLKNLEIPNGVTKIGDRAFYSCSSLTKVTIPEGVTKIGERMFEYCSNLTAIVIPDSVEEIGYRAFAECCSLKKASIGKGVNGMINAFSNCESLTSIILPKGITEIAGFDGCKSLKSIVIQNPGSYDMITIYADAFSGCDSFTDVWYTGTEDDYIYGKHLLSNQTWHYDTCEPDKHQYSDNKDATCQNCQWIREISAPGDIDNNSSVDNQDLALLMQYINGWDVEILQEAADVDKTIGIDNGDYALLMQFVNGWDVELQ